MTAILADSNESKEGEAQIVFDIGRRGDAAVEAIGTLMLIVGAPVMRDTVMQKYIALGTVYLIAAIDIFYPISIRVVQIVRILYFTANTANTLGCAIDVFVIVVGSTGFSADGAILLSTANSFPVVPVGVYDISAFGAFFYIAGQCRICMLTVGKTADRQGQDDYDSDNQSDEDPFYNLQKE